MMMKSISNKHSLIKRRLYPSSYTEKGGYKALLGIGGNIGDVVRRFEHLLWYFKRSSFIHVIETATIFKNPPFGYIEQDDFYNSLLLIETKLNPKDLLSYVLRVEKVFGRKRLFKDGPRTLDIDIIFYENVMMKTELLTLPHAKWDSRISVLTPLAHMKKAIR